MEVLQRARRKKGNRLPASETQENQSPRGPNTSYTFHIFVVSQLTRELRITSSDQATDLYKMDIRSTKDPNQIEITSTQTPGSPVIGTATYNPPSSRIDCTLHSHPLTLLKRGIFKSSHIYISYALAGKSLRWQQAAGAFSSGNTVLVDDESDMPLARLWPNKGFKTYKAGELELLGPAAMNEKVREEVLITGLALLELRRRRKRSSEDIGFGGGA